MKNGENKLLYFIEYGMPMIILESVLQLTYVKDSLETKV
jgi:hypothetical protein